MVKDSKIPVFYLWLDRAAYIDDLICPATEAVLRSVWPYFPQP